MTASSKETKKSYANTLSRQDDQVKCPLLHLVFPRLELLELRLRQACQLVRFLPEPSSMWYKANDYQLPVAVASPSPLHSLQPPVLETFLLHLFLACHHCPVVKVSHRRLLVASLRTSQCLPLVRDSLLFLLRAVSLDSPRARAPVPRQVWVDLRGRKGLMGRRHHLGVRQDFQDRLLGWATDGNRKKSISGLIFTVSSIFSCLCSHTIHIPKSFHFWFWEISFSMMSTSGTVLDESNLLQPLSCKDQG